MAKSAALVIIDPIIMSQAIFTFFDTLNDFLTPARRGQPISVTFKNSASVKDLIESLGVPHPEIDLILANGESVDFSYVVEDGDLISVYPAYPPNETGKASQVRPAPLHEFRFILDIHLGRLAAFLRMFGFDSLWRNDYPDEELAEVSHAEQRLLLTRDIGLLKRGKVIYGYWVRSTDPQRQLIEIFQRFQLFTQIAPFRRCLACNGLLAPVEKAQIFDQLEPRTREFYDEFHQCQQCQRIYWKGSHYEKMMNLIERVMKNS